MIVIVIVVVTGIAVVALGSAARVALRLRHRRRMAYQLRGDWWPRFEKAFRDYAARSAQRPRETDQ